MPAAPRILLAMPLIGGGAEVFIEIGAGLRRRGFDVEALVPHASRAHELDTGLRMHYYDVAQYDSPSTDSTYLAFQSVWGYGALRELRSLELEFDLVFAHLPWGIVKFYGYRRRRPLVGFTDCCWSDSWPCFNATDPRPEDRSWVNWKLACFLQEHTMRGCDRVIAPSRFFRDHHGGKGLKIDVILHGRDPERYKPAADRAALRTRLALPRDGKMVLIVGYDFGRKGHFHFAEVATRIRDADTFFVAVGPPVEAFRHWLEKDPTLASRFHVRPSVPHQDSPAYYAAADIFVFPTYFESFGLAPLEAMASGTPVVLQQASSMPELCDDGVEGYLFPRADVDALEARVRDLLRDDAKRRAMGDAARARFLRQFTEERMLDEYAAYFRDFLASAPSRAAG